MKKQSDPIVGGGGVRRAGVRPSAKILVVLGAVAFGLLAAEVGLRLIGFRYLILYREDADVGYSLRPGAEGWWRQEGEAYIRINSDGLRDREHAKEKPPGTLRVAVLGDSYAEALQVPAERAFWSVAERRLQDCAGRGGRKVEFINFGVSGFSTARELILLRTQVRQYSPDVVVLLFTTGNDVRDNSKALARKYEGLPLPYFVYRDGALVPDDSLIRQRNETLKFRFRQSFAGGALDWLRNHLRVVGLLDAARVAFQAVGFKPKERRAGFEPGLDAQVYAEPKDPAWAEAWRVTEGLLTLARDEAKSQGASLLVVTGSNGIQVHPDAAVRERFAREVGAEELFYPEARIRGFGEREGVDVLNLAPRLREYAERERVFLHGTDGSGHWNALGHRLVGDLLAERLCETTTANR
ncbi:MAG TPA: SGNH/GDSL hydrolase family protein [Pyrinomonadaceae bacterium]|nr:SGNH/GDSL hydrolase family protein [Pyrinomonadaceae bacterium]